MWRARLGLDDLHLLLGVVGLGLGSVHVPHHAQGDQQDEHNDQTEDADEDDEVGHWEEFPDGGIEPDSGR